MGLISCGSSPLARGTPGAVASNALKHAVHPRWRGEHHPRRRYSSGRTGSSPLARGTHRRKRRYEHRVRFIPAGAGNTHWPLACYLAHTVHPRWRGEHEDNEPRKRSRGGSSPLARGTPNHKPHRRASSRFIPAGAGNTRRVGFSPAEPTVHPRWRGEHTTLTQLAKPSRGSSPLARGTHDGNS